MGAREADDEQAAPGGEQATDLAQRGRHVEVVQDGDHRDQVDGALEVRQLLAADPDVRQVSGPRPGGPPHTRVRVGADHLVEAAGQLLHQRPLAAPDVQGHPATLGQVAQDPAVEVVVVAPRVAPVERREGTGRRAQHREAAEAAHVHAGDDTHPPTLGP